MGAVLHLLLALAAIGVAESGVEPLWKAPAAVLALLPLPYLAARGARRASLAGRFRLGGALLRLATWVPVLGYVAAVFGFGWHAAVLHWVGFTSVLIDWPRLAVVLSLAPLVALEALAVDARLRLFGGRRDELAGRRAFQLRLFASGFVPLLVYLVLAEAIARLPRLRATLEEVGLAAAAAVLGGFALCALALPLLLRRVWDTEPLRGPEHAWQSDFLSALAQSARFRYRGLLLWRTGGQMANAAILGFLPWHRFVLFSDLLLAQLGPRELAAVFAHEIGHAKRHHVAVFAAWGLGFFLAVDLLLQELGSGEELVAFALCAALLVAGYLGFGYLSRRFELDADLTALELTGDGEGLARALERVSAGHAEPKRTWRHFSAPERADFLRRAGADPGVGKALRRRTRGLSALGAALFLVCAGIEVRGLAAELPQDRVRVDLRLGEYARAAERARAGGDAVEPRLLALAERAAAAGPGVGPADWERAARGALSSGDAGMAGEYLELAVLCGRRDLTPLLWALDHLARDRPEEARAELRGVGDEWRAAFERFL